jgi:type IV secretion system protein VirD4
VLTDGDYPDRPPHRVDDWAEIVRSTDTRLAGMEDVAEDQGAGGGLEQARHPGHEIDKAPTAEPVQDDPLGFGETDTDPATDKRAMDQARAAANARTTYGVDAGLAPSQDLMPGF